MDVQDKIPRDVAALEKKKKKDIQDRIPRDVTALEKMTGRGQGDIAAYTRVCTSHE